MEAPSLLSSEALDPQRLIVETGIWHGCCKTRDPKVGPAREAGGMAYTGARSRFPAGPLAPLLIFCWHPNHVVAHDPA